MNLSHKVAVASLTRYPDKDSPRESLALRTAAEFKKLGIPFIVVDGGSHKGFLREIIPYATVITEINPERRFGVAWRQAVSAVWNTIGDDGIGGYIEPEKHTVVPFMPKLLMPLEKDGVDMVFATRTEAGRNSYPLEQRLSEALGIAYLAAVLGLSFEEANIGHFFGPIFGFKNAMDHFLEYEPDQGIPVTLADTWACYSVPRLNVWADKSLTWRSVEIDYIHPPEQTEVETGDPDLNAVRLDQLTIISYLLWVRAYSLELTDVKPTMPKMVTEYMK